MVRQSSIRNEATNFKQIFQLREEKKNMIQILLVSLYVKNRNYNKIKRLNKIFICIFNFK